MLAFCELPLLQLQLLRIRNPWEIESPRFDMSQTLCLPQAERVARHLIPSRHSPVTGDKEKGSRYTFSRAWKDTRVGPLEGVVSLALVWVVP